MRWGALLPLLLGLTLAQPRLAFAQPSDADRATARSLAAEGHDALQRKNYDVAEDRFRRADALVHAPTLVVDHARALTGLGRLAEAYRRYDLVIREGVPSSAPWAWKRALKEAQVEIQALKPSLGWLTVRVKGAESPEVTIDSDTISATELGTPRAVDPGERVVRAAAPGFSPAEERLRIAAGQSAELEIELRPEKVELAEEPVAPRPAAPAPVKIVKRLPPEKDRTLSYVAFGVGGALFATGVVTGILALNARSDLMDDCPDLKCTPRNQDEKARMEDDASRYRLLGTISGIGFGLGLAGAGAGLALLLLNDDKEQAPASKTAVVPFIGPANVGVRGSF